MADAFQVNELVGVRCDCARPPYCVDQTALVISPNQPPANLSVFLLYGDQGHRVQMIPAHPKMGSTPWCPMHWLRKLPPLPPEEQQLETAKPKVEVIT